MHIGDAVLSPALTVGTCIGAVALLAVALRRTPESALPRAALCAAALLAVSALRLPLGPVSVHPVLHGLAGILLGWSVVPCLFVSLCLQLALWFAGGVTSLGANLLVQALPALAAGCAARNFLRRGMGPGRAAWVGGLAGGGALVGSVLLTTALLWCSGESLRPVAAALAAAHLPSAAAEAAVTALLVPALVRTRPELFA